MTPGMQMFTTVFVAIIGSGIINLILQHHWEKNSEMAEIKNDVKEIKETVDSLKGTVDENAAIASRSRIIRFDDELLNGVPHSREYFRQILNDIDVYERFCKDNPDFKNTYTIEADKHIKKTFERLRDKGGFSNEVNHE